MSYLSRCDARGEAETRTRGTPHPPLLWWRTKLSLSVLGLSVRGMVKIDVDAVGKMLDELLAPARRPSYEDCEPDYEFLAPATLCTCSCH